VEWTVVGRGSIEESHGTWNRKLPEERRHALSGILPQFTGKDDWYRTGLRMAKDGVLQLSETLAIPRAELVYRASRAGGAGGQHVNTSSTRIELLWNVRDTQVLDDAQRARVTGKLASRLDGDGWLRVVSSARRSQLQNREAAEDRLVALITAALVVPRTRKATKPTRGSKETRLAEKKKRGDTKRQRRPDSFE